MDPYPYGKYGDYMKIKPWIFRHGFHTIPWCTQVAQDAQDAQGPTRTQGGIDLFGLFQPPLRGAASRG